MPLPTRELLRWSSRVKVAVGTVGIVLWGLVFDDLARSARWVLDTFYSNKFPMADLHSRYVDAHLVLAHAANFYNFRRGAFTYPPFAAYFFTPFHLVGFRATMTIWSLASMAALAGVIAVALRRWLAVAAADAWLISAVGLAPAAVFLFYPLRSMLVWGQIGNILLAMIVLDLFVVPRRFRGILIGVAAAIKLLPALFIVWLLARRELGGALRVVVTFALLTLLAAALWPHASIQYWFHVLPSGRDVQLAADPTGIIDDPVHWVFGVGKLTNQSLRGLFGRPPFLWVGDLPWLVVALGALAGGIAVTVRLLNQRLELAALLALSVTTVLVSPVSWLHYWSFVALAPILAIIEWRRDRPLAIAAIILAVSTCANLEKTDLSLVAPIVAFGIRNLYVIGGIVFLVVAAARAFRRDAAVEVLPALA
jgi:alpha-1,2-mannosyltransferase